MLADHFWPSVYPGLAVGIIVGLSLRTWAQCLAAALGGCFGAAISILVSEALALDEGALTVALLCVTAAGGAFLAAFASIPTRWRR